jgi:hypothetical protein
MRALFALAALPLLATFAPLALFNEPAIPAKPLLTFKPVPLVAEQPARRRLGRLVYLGRWELDSNDPASAAFPPCMSTATRRSRSAMRAR